MNQEFILIIGDDNYPDNNKVTNRKEKEYPFETVAFIPCTISEDIGAFRRIICMIYGKDNAENQIQDWTKNKKEGIDVALELKKEKGVVLANQKGNKEKIKNFLKDNTGFNTVVLLGYSAAKLKDGFLKNILSVKEIICYPHPSERSADAKHWGDIDYFKRGAKYDSMKTLLEVFSDKKQSD
ncbi:hypothetical protein POG77_00115 [Lactococcus petauri]|uniref:hypothetical protein n=1 Tax=Lactococcus petauri TaxID=1940789 RepID=UPI00232C313A|nr:hypothetical protein [Lactococcus petauri]MDC0814272.1 hypothetical protein [Lactococcus petauri]MDC0816315.1 hypothetical protein [Lactococcus petauri]MDC0822840.1 hypothetical protein [Lactococcus petauri]MDC0829360.1 hypothetical protein [Lactococcus petauri]MDT2551742.1 hypothetical protein [Lactococcus petauri]